MHRRVWFLLSLLFPLLLAACASAPVAERPDSLFADARFAPASQRIRAADVFALSDEMRRYLDGEIARDLRTKGRQRGLIDALYKQGQLKLDYDTAMTRNAAEAFSARSGNCLSLVLMTAALAKELGLEVQYQSAYIDETWSRSGDLILTSGHVNITLGRRMLERSAGVTGNAMTVDFLPADQIRGLRTSVIPEHVVVAMYMNNRAAETMLDGRLDDAYWWAREALVQSPGFMSAYNTLGVIYQRHGDLALADRVYAYVLEREPANTYALANRAGVLDNLGRVAEAALLRERLARIETHPPYHFFRLAQAAMARGDFKAGRDWLGREISRAPQNAEFHFWLSIAHYALGDMDAARKHLALARENSATRGQRDLYAAKLAWLQSQQRRQ